MSLKSRVYNQARVIMACVRYIHSVVINFGHKYMSVEGNYAAKIKLIIQNESNLSKLSPCAWPYIWRFRLFNFLKCKFFSNILASFPPCKIETVLFSHIFKKTLLIFENLILYLNFETKTTQSETSDDCVKHETNCNFIFLNYIVRYI